MRKFVVKNRQKRKYTKKSEEISSFSFSRTLYGMLPLIVMLVAFMSTVVISTPFRDSFSNIKFTIQVPEFSFNNPLTSLQALSLALIQFCMVLGAMLVAFFITMQHMIQTFGTMLLHAIFLLDPRPLFALFGTGILQLGNMLISAFIFIGEGIQSIVITLLHLFFLSLQGITSGILIVSKALLQWGSIVGQAIWADALWIGTAIANVSLVLGRTIIAATLFVGQILGTAFLAIIHIIVLVIQTIVSWIVAVFDAIATAIGNFFRAILYVIEFPFKILFAFWLQIKPYVVILLRHFQMAGADLSNVFGDGGKVISLMSPSK